MNVSTDKLNDFIHSKPGTTQILDLLLEALFDLQSVIEYRKENNLPYENLKDLVRIHLNCAFQIGIGMGIEFSDRS